MKRLFQLPNWLKKMKNRFLKVVILLLPICLLVFSCQSRKIDTRLRWAEELKGTRKFDEALQVYKLVVNNYPNDPKTAVAYLKMGDLYRFTMNDGEAALEAFSKATEKWPLTEAAREAALKKAEIFASRGNFRKAINEYEWVIKYFPGYPENAKIKLEVAEGYLSMNDPYQARVELENLIKDEEIDLNNKNGGHKADSWWACFGTECLFSVKELNGEGLSDEILSKSIYNLGESYLFMEEHAKALKYFRYLEKNYQDVPFLLDARLRIAECMEQLNMIDEALRYQMKLAKWYPDSEVVKSRIEAITKRGKKNEKPEGAEIQIKDELKVKGGMKKLYGSKLDADDKEVIEEKNEEADKVLKKKKEKKEKKND